MKVSNRLNELLRKNYCNIDESFINDDQYPNEITSEIKGANDIVLEAKRLILNEQIDKLIDINLSNFGNFNQTNEVQANPTVVQLKSSNKIIDDLIKIKNHFIPPFVDDIEVINDEANKVVDYEITRKYFIKWKRETGLNKNLNAGNIDDKYEEFFKELGKRQTTLCANPKFEDEGGTSTKAQMVKVRNARKELSKHQETFKNRYNAQAKIILSQKYKLLEQEKQIEELKYGKVREELLKSLEENKKELSELSSKVSTKTRCKLGVIVKDDQKPLNLDPVKVPKVIREMEKRAQERELRREQIKERKRLIEEERRKNLLEIAENKRKQDEEEKRRNLEAIKERRKKEMEIEKRKREEKLRQEEKNRKADEFYGKLMRRKVLNIFKQLLLLMDENEQKSKMFYEISLEKTVFTGWKLWVQAVVLRRNFKADDLWRKKCLRSSFEALKENFLVARRNKQVADDFYEFSLTKRIFGRFHIIVCKEKMRRYKLHIKAVHHYNSRLLLHYFYQWKSLPIVLQLEKAKEEKKRKWREKVMQILPDYKPVLYDDDDY